jgi:hypothetical protein
MEFIAPIPADMKELLNKLKQDWLSVLSWPVFFLIIWFVGSASNPAAEYDDLDTRKIYLVYNSCSYEQELYTKEMRTLNHRI